MRMREERQPADVAKIYDQVSAIASTFGDGQFHQGYWYDDRDETPFVEAAKRITRRVADSLGVGEHDHLLDAGCGPGASALLIAEETGARVTGISVSDFEISEARMRCAEAGLDGRVHFENGDYSAMAFADGTFDAVMAVESLLVAADLDRVLTEFWRVLRPGGRVTLSHYTRSETMAPERVEAFLRGIAAVRLPSLTEWVESLRNNGFLIEEYLQCGPRVFGRNGKYLAAVEASQSELAEKFGRAELDMFRTGLKGFLMPGPDEVGYGIVTGRKPFDA